MPKTGRGRCLQDGQGFWTPRQHPPSWGGNLPLPLCYPSSALHAPNETGSQKLPPAPGAVSALPLFPQQHKAKAFLKHKTL